MRYVPFEFGNTEFKLRLTAQTATELEKRLGGQNPLNMLMAVESGQMPSMTNVLLILHASMQKLQHGITVQKVMDMYDDYVESGRDFTDLIPKIIEVFEVSGFFPKAKPETAETPASL